MRRPLAARRLVVLVAVSLAVIGTAACAEPVPSRDELAEALQDSGLSASVARCTADAVTESLSAEQLARIAERGPGGAPRDDPDATSDPVDQVREAMVACRAELPTTTTTTTVASSSTTAVGGLVDDGASFDTAPTTGTDAAGSSPTTGTDPTGKDPAGTAPTTGTVAADVDGTGPATTVGP